MDEQELTIDERQIVGRCLYEAADGAYFPDWEFETLIGTDRAAVRKAASIWLAAGRVSGDARGVTLSVLNSLLGYPHYRTSELERCVGAPISTLKSILERYSIEAARHS
jgi:hypothetical protein